MEYSLGVKHWLCERENQKEKQRRGYLGKILVDIIQNANNIDPARMTISDLHKLEDLMDRLKDQLKSNLLNKISPSAQT